MPDAIQSKVAIVGVGVRCLECHQVLLISSHSGYGFIASHQPADYCSLSGRQFRLPVLAELEEIEEPVHA